MTTINPEKVVVFHHDDLDGVCAAAVIRKLYPVAVCHSISYGGVLPIDTLEPDTALFIVDFTPETEADWQRIMGKTNNVTWIDHHQKNIEKYNFYNMALKGLRVDTKPSGALATWQFLFPDKPVHDAVTYTSDYDTWTYDFGEHTKRFEAGMSALNSSPDSKLWIDLLSDDVITRTTTMNLVLDTGNIIVEHRKITNKKIVEKYGFSCEFEGYKVLACNAPTANSILFDSVFDKAEYDILSVFASNGKKVMISLYSEKSNINCADIASKYGGGGHPGAAGFQIESIPFTNIESLKGDNTCRRLT